MIKERDPVEMRLDKVIELLQQLVALEMSRRGATQETIGKGLHVAKATVVKMLSGVKKDGGNV